MKRLHLLSSISLLLLPTATLAQISTASLTGLVTDQMVP
jgi:hypothetical protein